MLWWRFALRRQIVVNLTDGSAIRGVLMRARGPLLVLRNAEYVGPGGMNAGVDGEAVIERSRVLFVQLP